MHVADRRHIILEFERRGRGRENLAVAVHFASDDHGGAGIDFQIEVIKHRELKERDERELKLLADGRGRIEQPIGGLRAGRDAINVHDTIKTGEPGVQVRLHLDCQNVDARLVRVPIAITEFVLNGPIGLAGDQTRIIAHRGAQGQVDEIIIHPGNNIFGRGLRGVNGGVVVIVARRQSDAR